MAIEGRALLLQQTMSRHALVFAVTEDASKRAVNGIPRACDIGMNTQSNVIAAGPVLLTVSVDGVGLHSHITNPRQR